MTNDLLPKQIIILAIYCAMLWFIAAMIVRIVGPLGAFEGQWMALTFALVIPGTVPAIILARIIASLSQPQIVNGIVVVTAAALLLDGIAHAWFPELYSANSDLRVNGAATIFWGAGVGLVLAMIMTKPAAARQ